MDGYPETASVAPKSGSKSVLISVIIGLALVGIVLYFWYPRPTGERGGTYEPTLEETKYALLKNSTLDVSENTPLTIISASALPADLTFLVPAQTASGPVAKQAMTSDGRKLYTVNFSQAGDLFAVHRKFYGLLRTAPGWSIVRGSRTNLFAVVEAENIAYQIRVNETAANESITDVLIQAVSK